MKKLLLITGYSCSGKDTVGKHLVNYYDYKRYAFADILKKRFSDLYDIPLIYLFTQYGKKKEYTIGGITKSLREHLIDFAEYNRKIDPDIWVNLLLEQIKLNKEERICITDWRQLNELEILKDKLTDYKIITIRITKPDAKPYYSDNFLDEYETDYTITNNSSFLNLYNKINKISI